MKNRFIDSKLTTNRKTPGFTKFFPLSLPFFSLFRPDRTPPLPLHLPILSVRALPQAFPLYSANL